MKAIAQATGRSLDRIKADAAAQGDLGLVAESSRSTQKTLFQSPPLTVTGVFHKLKEIAALSGIAVCQLGIQISYYLLFHWNGLCDRLVRSSVCLSVRPSVCFHDNS